MTGAIGKEVSHNASVDFRDEGIVGDVLRDHVFGPRLKAALYVELALQPPDHRLRKRDVAFQGTIGCCYYSVLRHGSLVRRASFYLTQEVRDGRQNKRPGDVAPGLHNTE